jgi:hypothetical protein
MFINGAWEANVTCPRCRNRHPARLECAEAAAIAAANRAANRAVAGPSGPRPVVAVGRYSISAYHDGQVWLARENGEGMAVSATDLARVIDDFFRERF